MGGTIFDETKGSIIDPDESVIRLETIPDRLEDGGEQIVGKPIYDPVSKRLYTVTPREFAFYQRHGLPLPRVHFLRRLESLFGYSNTMFADKETACDSCMKKLLIHPNRHFSNRRVLCIPCYESFITSR